MVGGFFVLRPTVNKSEKRKILCKNCQTEFLGNFCHHCGQASEVLNINWAFLWQDARCLVTGHNSSILLTIKDLFLRPGYFIRDFLNGKRVRRLNPVRLTVTVAGIYGSLYYSQNLHKTLVFLGNESERNARSLELALDWALRHYALIAVSIIPFFSFSTYIVFRKLKWSYAEHLAIGGFLASQHLIIKLFFLIMAVSFKTPTKVFVTTMPQVFSLLFCGWSLYQLFTVLGKVQVIWRIGAAVILFVFLYLTTIVGIYEIYVNF
jgi:hypothetical protein